MHKLVEEEQWFANSLKNIAPRSFNSHLTNVMRGSTEIDIKLQKTLIENDEQAMMQKLAM